MKRTIHGLLAAAALVLAPASSAGAQSNEEAEISIESSEPGSDLSVTYRIRVVGKDSRVPTNGASITATALGPDGARAAPVALSPRDTDGGYSGLQHFPAPGQWAVRVTVDSPSGSVEFVQEVGNAPATTTTTTVPIPTSTAAAAPESTMPLAVPAEEEQPGEEITAGSFVFLIAILVVVGGFVLVLRRGRRRSR